MGNDPERDKVYAIVDQLQKVLQGLPLITAETALDITRNRIKRSAVVGAPVEAPPYAWFE